MTHEPGPDLFLPDPDEPPPDDVQVPPVDPKQDEEIDPDGLDGDERDDLDGDTPATFPVNPALIPESPGHPDELPT